MIRTSLLIPILAMVLMLGACAKQQVTTAPKTEHRKEHTIQTMVTGIDQFDEGTVWGVNTGHGIFVVGPEVSKAMKTQVFEHLMEAHDEVIIIRYVDMSAGDGMVAHKRVTSMVIQETPYFFSR